MDLSLRKIKLSKFSMVFVFSNMLYSKKPKAGNAGNQQKAFEIRKNSLLAVTIIRKLLKSYQFGIYVPFWLQEQGKFLLSFIATLTLIILINTLRVVPRTHRTLRKVLSIIVLLFSVFSRFSNLLHTLFTYRQHFFISNTRLKLAKISSKG